MESYLKHPLGPKMRERATIRRARLAQQAEISARGRDGNPGGGGASPSLVDKTDNSPNVDSGNSVRYCPNARWVQGECDAHGNQRWVLAPCKKRSCEVCGPLGRYEIAKRIAYGVRELWPCSWHVLTFDTEDAEESEWKPKAVRKLGKYVAWLRKQQPDLQYAATYELTERGRLHINLVIGPWEHVSQAELQDRWGAILWVEWVRDSEAIGQEAGKSYSPEALGKYLAKLEQAVPAEWGRRVSFSKGWPKLPKEPVLRKGKIIWRQEWELEQVEISRFEVEKDHGWWEEVAVGEWRPLLSPHDCDCFDLVFQDDG